MTTDLKILGMENGLHYEGIYTTISKDGIKDAAPIGINCKDNNKIGCRIFVGSTTLKNIQETKEFIINITDDPIAFVKSTIGNLDKEDFTNDENIAMMKNADAYIKCKVISIEKMEPIADHINSHGEAYLIDSEVIEIIKNNKCAKALNRGFFSFLESLSNYTRLDIVDKEKQDYYVGRFNENKRIINRVSDDKTKEAMDILGNAMIKKGFNVD
ncbi:hypothetical protein BGI41_02900 [Methanobrevibacter sp. 87.7]|uniref:DUF447 domain-containing protein n=1 Tax=Methanobrevibacter sp. 87.7 TaxID=387957 RepID=UPI000B51447E|nr:DUF447 domain-containing protein [Methanobrevibacter sp. 87.7]OWT33351.1 hypothetical protein BGI41_02900 [Methanobrevibacter sp. 87.7]